MWVFRAILNRQSGDAVPTFRLDDTAILEEDTG